jgi:energy-coupling factor transport system ATP-binding protein
MNLGPEDRAAGAVRSMEPRATPAIRVEHLTHVYARGQVVALQDVSFMIATGEAVGIVGQNGSGKTTLAKHLNGLLKPTAGRVLIEGEETTDKRVQQLAAKVGYVFQNPNHQLFASTVEEDLAFGPRNLGLSAAEVRDRVEEAIAFFGLQAVRALHPYRISFPMRKLVGIAAIYAMRPSIFVLDEPTTGQDHVTTRIINGLIHRLRDQGATVICVAHDMPLLADVVERILVMWNGQLIADDTPRAVFADRDVMARTRLRPPQVTEIALRLDGTRGYPVALSVAELVQAVAKDLVRGEGA